MFITTNKDKISIAEVAKIVSPLIGHEEPKRISIEGWGMPLYDILVEVYGHKNLTPYHPNQQPK